MCGLLGRLRITGDGATRRPLRRGLPRLGRRGPDGCRDWTSPDGALEFLHARLGIVDRSAAADQPLWSESLQTCVMFVGEIYNYRELRAEYGDYPYLTDSDTEVILAVYAKDGPRGLGRLRGMFTIAIADLRARQLILCRDGIGKKPLYVARWGGDLYFGSSVIALRATYGGPVAIAPTAVHDYWLYGYIPPDRSAISDCAPIQPGSIVAIDLDTGRTDIHRLEMPAVEVPETLADAEAQLDRLFRRAVERRLDNNPHPTALLSGGIDSTVVVDALAGLCRQRELPLHVLTLGSLIPLTNDERYARYAARKIGVDLEVVRLGSQSIGEAAVEALDHQDEPLAMLSFLPLYRLVKAAAERSRILIGGDGGDEVFLGYGQAADWVQPGSLVFRGKTYGQPAPPTWMSAYGWRAATTDLIGHGFTKVDRASAEQGVEMRAPLLDSDLVAFARTLPRNIILAGGDPKVLLNRRLEGWPDWFVRRRKMGFAYNLRWAWMPSNFSGLREAIADTATAHFEPWLPMAFRKPAATWARRDIMANFPLVWLLLSWSRFEQRLGEAEAA